MSTGPTPRWRRRRALGKGEPDRQRGSALILAPVGMLVLVLLAAMTVDGALAVLGQRQLANALASAAADAANAGVDQTDFYHHGQIALDPPDTQTLVCDSLRAQADLHLRHLRVWVAVAGPEVTLLGRAEITPIFGRAVPGIDHWPVAATATATAEQRPRTPPHPLPTTGPPAC